MIWERKNIWNKENLSLENKGMLYCKLKNCIIQGGPSGLSMAKKNLGNFRGPLEPNVKKVTED